VTQLININNASLQFADGTVAISDTSLQVEQGEFVAIVGPSGCGKSTLLRLASGLISPTSGTVERSASVQYVFQDSTLLPWRTVKKNVALNLELQKIDPQKLNGERIRQLISLDSLTALINCLANFQVE